jgi:hypothetical protein
MQMTAGWREDLLGDAAARRALEDDAARRELVDDLGATELLQCLMA